MRKIDSRNARSEIASAGTGRPAAVSLAHQPLDRQGFGGVSHSYRTRRSSPDIGPGKSSAATPAQVGICRPRLHPNSCSIRLDPEQELRARPALVAAELATFLAGGLELAQVAQRLRISIHTARTHLKAIYAKTGSDPRRSSRGASPQVLPREVPPMLQRAPQAQPHADRLKSRLMVPHWCFPKVARL